MTSDPDLSTFDDAVVLVTGGAGFVGSNLIRRLLRNAKLRAILVIDNFLSSDPWNLPSDPRLQTLFGSAADDRILGLLPPNIDYVFHLACFHGNQSSIHDALADHHNNSFPALKLFDSLKDHTSLKKVVYSAAGCAVAEKTFGEPAATSEDAAVSLFHDSPYSISKLIGEMYGNYYYSNFGLPFVKARFQNVYGPGEFLGAGQWRGTEHTIWRNVIPTFVWNALTGLPLLVDGRGETSRDFIYVGDIVKGLIACAVRGSEGQSYNLGSGTETKIRDLAELVIMLSGADSKIEWRSEARPWDSSGRRFADTRKSSQEIGFTATTPLSVGLEGTISWTIKNKLLIEKSIERHLWRVSAGE